MWFVCYCEPRKTLSLVGALAERGRQVECPSFRFRRRLPRKNKTHEIERPLIGGIFFCHERSWPLGSGLLCGVELGEIRRMLWMNKPAKVSDKELERLRAVSRSRTISRTKFSRGDRVIVDVGPFKGAIGIVADKERGQLILHVENMSLPLKCSPVLVRKE